MFKVSIGDFWRGLIMAVLTPVMIAVFAVLSRVITSDFDVFSTDFVALLKELTNTLIIASYSGFSSYLLKNFLTDDNQNFLGIKPISK